MSRYAEFRQSATTLWDHTGVRPTHCWMSPDVHAEEAAAYRAALRYGAVDLEPSGRMVFVIDATLPPGTFRVGVAQGQHRRGRS